MLLTSISKKFREELKKSKKKLDLTQFLQRKPIDKNYLAKNHKYFSPPKSLSGPCHNHQTLGERLSYWNYSLTC